MSLEFSFFQHKFTKNLRLLAWISRIEIIKLGEGFSSKDAGEESPETRSLETPFIPRSMWWVGSEHHGYKPKNPRC